MDSPFTGASGWAGSATAAGSLLGSSVVSPSAEGAADSGCGGAGSAGSAGCTDAGAAAFLLPGRRASFSDIVANTIGALLGALLAALIYRRTR